MTLEPPRGTLDAFAAALHAAPSLRDAVTFVYGDHLRRQAGDAGVAGAFGSSGLLPACMSAKVWVHSPGRPG